MTARNDPRRLAALASVVGLMAARHQQPVQQALARVRAQEAQIDRIAATRQALLTGMDDLSRAAQLGQQAERLRQVQGGEVMKLAAARAELARCRGLAAKSQARKLALEALQRRPTGQSRS